MENPAIILGILALIGAVLAIGRWIGRTDSRLGNLESLVTEIRDDIKGIFAKIGLPMIASGSPVKLTELGEEVSKSLGATAWAAGVAPELRDRVVDKEPFQIEEFARTYVTEELSDEWKNKVAQEAFRRGSRRDDIGSVLWVVLRDELLRLTGKTLED